MPYSIGGSSIFVLTSDQIIFLMSLLAILTGVSMAACIVTLTFHFFFWYFMRAESNRITLRLIATAAFISIVRGAFRYTLFAVETHTATCQVGFFFVSWLDIMSPCILATVGVHTILVLIVKVENPWRLEKFYYLGIVLYSIPVALVSAVMIHIGRIQFSSRVSCWTYLYLSIKDEERVNWLVLYSMNIFPVAVAFFSTVTLLIRYFMERHNFVSTAVCYAPDVHKHVRPSLSDLSQHVDPVREFRWIIVRSAMYAFVAVVCKLWLPIHALMNITSKSSSFTLYTVTSAVNCSQGALISVLYFMDPVVWYALGRCRRYVRRVFVDEYDLPKTQALLRRRSMMSARSKDQAGTISVHSTNNNDDMDLVTFKPHTPDASKALYRETGYFQPLAESESRWWARMLMCFGCRRKDRRSSVCVDKSSRSDAKTPHRPRRASHQINPYTWPLLAKAIHFFLTRICRLKPRHTDDDDDLNNDNGSFMMQVPFDEPFDYTGPPVHQIAPVATGPGILGSDDTSNQPPANTSLSFGDPIINGVPVVTLTSFNVQRVMSTDRRGSAAGSSLLLPAPRLLTTDTPVRDQRNSMISTTSGNAQRFRPLSSTSSMWTSVTEEAIGDHAASDDMVNSNNGGANTESGVVNTYLSKAKQKMMSEDAPWHDLHPQTQAEQQAHAQQFLSHPSIASTDSAHPSNASTAQNGQNIRIVSPAISVTTPTIQREKRRPSLVSLTLSLSPRRGSLKKQLSSLSTSTLHPSSTLHPTETLAPLPRSAMSPSPPTASSSKKKNKEKDDASRFSPASFFLSPTDAIKARSLNSISPDSVHDDASSSSSIQSGSKATSSPRRLSIQTRTPSNLSQVSNASNASATSSIESNKSIIAPKKARNMIAAPQPGYQSLPVPPPASSNQETTTNAMEASFLEIPLVIDHMEDASPSGSTPPFPPPLSLTPSLHPIRRSASMRVDPGQLRLNSLLGKRPHDAADAASMPTGMPLTLDGRDTLMDIEPAAAELSNNATDQTLVLPSDGLLHGWTTLIHIENAWPENANSTSLSPNVPMTYDMPANHHAQPIVAVTAPPTTEMRPPVVPVLSSLPPPPRRSSSVSSVSSLSTNNRDHGETARKRVCVLMDHWSKEYAGSRWFVSG